jgi:hypothetical protein
MHGFPYDPRAYDGMVPPLVAAGCRAIVPYRAATVRRSSFHRKLCALASRRR